MFDRYGEHVLKNGIPGKLLSITVSGQNIGAQWGYSFSGDPMEIFESFFGTINPYHIALDDDG